MTTSPRRSAAPDAGEAPRPARPARSGPPDRPPAPWGKFPLVELVVLLALVMLVAGFFVQGDRGITLIAAGVALGSLAGLELAIREHFAGYRSHTTVLAGAPAVLILGVGFFLPGGWPRDRRLRRLDRCVRGRRLSAARGLQAPLGRARVQGPLGGWARTRSPRCGQA